MVRRKASPKQRADVAGGGEAAAGAQPRPKRRRTTRARIVEPWPFVVATLGGGWSENGGDDSVRIPLLRIAIPLDHATSGAQLAARRGDAGFVGLFVNDALAATPAWSENIVKAVVILLQNGWLSARLDRADPGDGPRQSCASLRLALVRDGTKAFSVVDEHIALGKAPRSPCRRALVTVLDTLLPPPADAVSTMVPGEATHDWLYRSTAAQLDRHRRSASASASASGSAAAAAAPAIVPAAGAAVRLGAETESALERVLRPNLRPYQKRALRWMLRREHGKGVEGESEGDGTLGTVADGSEDPSLCLWSSEGTVAPDGPPHHEQQHLALWVQRESGRVRIESVSAPPAFEDRVRGGILADEMGLGKTVVVIALIAAHPHAVAGRVEEASAGRTEAGAAAAEEEEQEGALAPVHTERSQPLSLRVRVHPQWSWGSNAARLRAERFGALAPNRVIAHILRCSDRASLSVLRPRSDEIACPCGVAESDDAGIWLRCVRCRCMQHAACVGKHGDAVEAPHTCMGCLSRLAPRATRATLVICPAAILSQWQDEIAKHTQPGAVQVVVYMGVRAALRGLQTHGAAKSGGLGDIDPERLACADVVLTTFSVLRQDIHHAKPVERAAPRRGGRRQKYAHVPSPLLMLHWHRCVIDEAQMVHSESCNATAMARRLRCTLRWAVTGTPVSGSFNDLQGLLAFLGAAPFADSAVWRTLIEAPLLASAPGAASRSCAAKVRAERRARALFNRLMWRHAKTDVADELHLPPQHHHEVCIELSPIERHFYGAQEEECHAIAKQVAAQAKAAADAEEAKKKHMREESLPPPRPTQWSATSSAGSSAAAAMEIDVEKGATLTEAQRAHEQRTETSAASGSLEENMARLLNPLLRLRQACCHPQIGAHGLRGVAGQSMKSLDVCHGLMMKHQQNKAMESLRSVCASKNGLAGLMLLTGDPDVSYEEGGLGQPDGTVRTTTKRKEACQLYRSVCTLSDAHRGKLGKKGEKPSFAKIHALRRLVKQLRATPDGDHEGATAAQPALVQAEIARLTKKADEMQATYLGRFQTNVRASEASLTKIGRDIDALSCVSSGSWWSRALDGQCVQQFLQHADMLRIEYRRDRGTAGLLYVLGEWITKFADARSIAIGCLKKACATPSAMAVVENKTCGKCRAYLHQTGPTCEQCNIEAHVIAFDKTLHVYPAGTQQTLLRPDAGEDLIIHVERERGTVDNDVRMKGNRLGVTNAPALKLLLYMAKEASVHAPDFAKQIALAKREASVGKQLWRAQWDLLSARDEMDMVEYTLRLSTPADLPLDPNDLSTIHIVENTPHHVQQKDSELRSEIFQSELNLTQELSKLSYLSSLVSERREAVAAAAAAAAPSAAAATGGTNVTAVAPASAIADECVICREPFEGHASVLRTCGHKFCYQCTQTLIQRRQERSNTIKCPNCRDLCPISEIVHVNLGLPSATAALEHADDALVLFARRRPQDARAGAAAAEETRIVQRVDGSWGAKVDAIVRVLKYIQDRGEGCEKALVFSQWEEVLHLVGQALAGNGVEFRRLKGAALSASRVLHEFKHTASIQVLLLPTKSGANGVNLTEASHVLMCEPLLEAGVEAQALGRVDRIGQMNATHVYHFFAKNTIEERIYTLRHAPAAAEARPPASSSAAVASAAFGAASSSSSVSPSAITSSPFSAARSKVPLSPSKATRDVLTVADVSTLFHRDAWEVPRAAAPVLAPPALVAPTLEERRRMCVAAATARAATAGAAIEFVEM